MTDLVDRTLRHWRQTPFEWGQEDCLLSVGEYARQCNGATAVLMFRGTYSTPAGAARIIRAYGSVPALLDLLGWLRIDGEPQRGDILAIRSDDCIGGLIGGICTGSGVAARTTNGVIETHIRLVQIGGIWRCP